MFKSLLALSLVFCVDALASSKAEEAAEAYSQRGYDSVGIQMVQKAVDLYDQAIADEADAVIKAELMNSQASAYYFLGQALEKKVERKKAHVKAMDLADAVMTAMGVNSEKAHELDKDQVSDILNRLDEQSESALAEAFYAKGISLAQWGNLDGIASSVGRIGEVLGLMERIEMMGYESIHEYGPYRTIGRVKFVLPKLFGGDLKASEKYLLDAYKNSLVPGTRYSINGYNNIYLAETMHKRGKELQAKRILETFLAADPATLKPDNEVENQEALEIAQDILNEWT